MVNAKGVRWGFDVKYQDGPTITKSMRIAMQDLKLQKLWVVYPGKTGYPLDEKIERASLGEMARSGRHCNDEGRSAVDNKRRRLRGESGTKTLIPEDLERFGLQFAEGVFAHRFEETPVDGLSNFRRDFRFEAEGYAPFVSQPFAHGNGVIGPPRLAEVRCQCEGPRDAEKEKATTPAPSTIPSGGKMEETMENNVRCAHPPRTVR